VQREAGITRLGSRRLGQCAPQGREQVGLAGRSRQPLAAESQAGGVEPVLEAVAKPMKE